MTVHQRYKHRQDQDEDDQYKKYKTDIKEVNKRIKERQKRNIESSQKDYRSYMNNKRTLSSYSFSRPYKNSLDHNSSIGNLSSRRHLLYVSQK